MVRERSTVGKRVKKTMRAVAKNDEFKQKRDNRRYTVAGITSMCVFTPETRSNSKSGTIFFNVDFFFFQTDSKRESLKKIQGQF